MLDEQIILDYLNERFDDFAEWLEERDIEGSEAGVITQRLEGKYGNG